MSTPVTTRAGPGPGPDAERAGAGSTRSPRDAVAPRSPVGPGQPVLGRVPRPLGDAAVVALDPATTAGGLSAVQAEWGVDGGAVVLSGRAPFTELTGRAGFRSDGSLDGSVEMRARVGLLGLHLGEATWRVEGWAPEQPLAGPAVTLRGTTLGVDLRPLPAEAGWSAPEGVDAPRSGAQATIHLPGDAVPPGLPLTPRVAEVYRGLLGVDVSGIRVHPDAPVAGAPAFVTDEDLFLAPGVYGVDSPEMLAVLDAAIRAALGGLFGAVTGDPAPLVPPAPPTPAAPPADTTVVPATVPEPASPSTVAEGAAARTGEAPATGETAEQATAAVAGAGAVGADGGTVADGIPGGDAGGPTAEGEAAPPVVELIMPEPPATLTPAAAARGGSVAGGARSAAGAARDLPTADANVADSRGAVTEPAAETAARAREELAAELGERPAPSPEIVALCERIRTAIRENRPEDEDALLETDPTHEAQAAGATITGSVQTQTAEVGSSYDAMAAPPAGTPALTPRPIAAPSPTSPGMGVDAAGAAPDPIPPENTSLDADVAATDQRIADSGIDTRVTQEIPDGPFAEARAARGELGEAAQRTPQQIQAEQQQAIDTAQGDMAALQQQAVAAMRASRSGTVGAVGGAQGGMVSSEEQTRESVSARAQGIYDQAQTQVNALLEPLSRTAIARWDAGLARLSQEFHDTLDRVKRWIDDRHSGVGGAILAVGDYIGGLPDWVTDEYNRAEREFGDGVCTLLTDISSDVNGVVAAAQAVINHARDDIDTAFRAMEEEFPEWAAQERARFAGMLDGLSQRVTDAQTSFVRDVSQRAVQAVNEVHAEAQARRDEAGGLIGRVVAAIEEFIDDPVRAIINGLLRLVGIPPAAFWALIARIEQVISDIADDPENFINNLVAGVKQGFEQFFDHFGTHVLHGFWDWLFSGLETPIPMPRDFSARSLFSFALQLMGVTWPRVREILVRHIGPTAVDVIEAAWQLVSVLIERGPEGLVELVKEQLTPENIVNMILEAAVQYLVETLIQQVVVRVIGMLNPVGAIAQAIDLIYQVCSWIFRNAARIFRFVEAIVNGMADVIAGNIGGLAAAVERSLASLIPPVIDFLAGLLHLGGLPGEIADVITRMQAVVYAAMDRVIGFLAERGRALLARMGIGGDPEDAGHNDDTELGTTVRFSAAHEAHRTWIDRSGNDATLMVASTPTAIRDKAAEWRGRLSSIENVEDRSAADAKLTELDGLLTSMDADADALAQAFEAANRDPRDDQEPPSDNALESRQRGLASVLRECFELFEEKDPDEYLRDIASHLQGHGTEYAATVASQWEPTIARPKLAPDGTTPIWEPSVVSTDGARSYLGQASTHRQLLPWFLVGSQRNPRSASSGTFKNHAFETDSPDPAHTVRTDFLRVLGSDTVTRMIRVANRSITTEDNSALLRQIQTMTFTASGGRWGSFVGLPADVVNPLIRTAISRAGDVIAFLRAMVSPGSSNGVTWAQFIAVWNASAETKNYVKRLFRNVEPASHEWITTGFIPRVIETAVETANTGNIRDGLRWVVAHNTLRSPTRYVLHPPVVTTSRAPRGMRAADSTVATVRMSGHVGAFRDPADPTSMTGTMGTEDFHDWLRNEFNAQNGLGPLAYIQHLQSQLPGRVWDGGVGMIPESALSQPVGMLFRLESGEDAALTVAQLAFRQRLNWQRIQANFAASSAAVAAETGA
ncbi:hypothetical protein [Terrabacter sp. Soil810]|uniref:hypothetical protein n=1 Tax=Terrabacter sp. Soil810 TaxID=1736418 RepID=UPI00070BA843|nr:hypothetical protein [Terrabacter sp. Soil810]KRF46544.1 hypothetical protein ASG96_00360 [Terrabacter sp. Soil810]